LKRAWYTKAVPTPPNCLVLVDTAEADAVKLLILLNTELMSCANWSGVKEKNALPGPILITMVAPVPPLLTGKQGPVALVVPVAAQSKAFCFQLVDAEESWPLAAPDASLKRSASRTTA
jgi:hypothetical protein